MRPARYDGTDFPGSDHVGAACDYCHNPSYPPIPQHTTAELDTLHLSTTTGCNPCHDPGLTAEHGQYPLGTDFKYQCSLCHASTDPTSWRPSAAGDTACAGVPRPACTPRVHDPGFTDPLCADCHSADIVVEHNDDCAGCHTSTDPNVVNAIATGDSICGACHEGAGHAAVHDGGLPSGGGCGECHDSKRVGRARGRLRRVPSEH